MRDFSFQGILTLCLLGFLLPARGQDPWLVNTNYPLDTNVSVGATVSFRAYPSTATPSMLLQWQHAGTNLLGATNSILSITNLTVAHAGGYVVWITNAIGGFTNTRTAMATVDTTFTKITQGPLVTDREPTGGVAWGDYDGDGRLDLIALNHNVSGTYSNTLYRNLGGDQFVRVTNALTAAHGRTWGAQWADVDNDGDLDLFILRPFRSGATMAQNEFFRNDGGGVFTPMTNAATAAAGFWTDATWVDQDSDGWLDLFATTQSFTAGQPLDDYLWRNLTDGRFVPLTTNDVGVVLKPQAKTAGPAWCDIDGDGDLDLYVSNNGGVTNFLYRNDGGRLIPVKAGSLPAERSTWAAVWADFNNDGLFDLFTGGENGTNTLQLNRGNWVFEDVTIASGLALTGNVYTASAGDFDNDGDGDLYVPVYDAADVLYINRGDGTFDRVNVGSPLTEGFQNGATWVDFNNDGFLDLFEPCGDTIPTLNLLYRNSLPQYGNTNHWLKLRLKGTVSNASAIGARVWVRATIGGKDTWQVQQITSACLTAVAADGMRVHFGLGDATSVTTARIEWPSGNVQQVNLGIDQTTTVTESTFITPARPSASLNGSATLTRAALTGATYQWRFDGVDLIGQTNRILNLTNIIASQEGRYSVVVSNASTLVTNFVYLSVDTQFTKITTDPLVEDKLTGSGLLWGDYDNDNNVDLLVLNNPDTGARSTNILYRNQGNGTFARVTSTPFDGEQGAYGGGAWADLNNDGWLDFYAPDLIRWYSGGATANHLMYLGGAGGSFTKVAGYLTDSAVAMAWDTTWGDFDNDGLVDLFAVGAWVDRGTRNHLFRNTGNGNFARVTQGRIVTDAADSELAAASDYDGDGDLDLLVSSHSQRLLYQNNGAGNFTRITTGPIALDTGNSAGPAWGDYDNDGDMDLCLATFDQTLHLFNNDGAGNFSRTLLGPPSNYQIPNWGDYDNDGWLDLFVTHGYGSGELRNRLFHNNGDGTFTEVKTGSLSNEGGYSFASAWADYDNNGFLDLVVGNGYKPVTNNFLYHNNGNSNRWLIVKLVGTTSNRSAIGAKVRARAVLSGKAVWQLREITCGGCRAQNDLRTHFGLGNATSVTTLRIEWPSGTVQELTNQPANQMLTIVEPRRPVLALEATPTGFTGTLNADTNQTYQVQASEDVAAGWTVLTNITTDATGSARWSDLAPASQGRRFYKAVKTP